MEYEIRYQQPRLCKIEAASPAEANAAFVAYKMAGATDPVLSDIHTTDVVEGTIRANGDLQSASAASDHESTMDLDFSGWLTAHGFDAQSEPPKPLVRRTATAGVRVNLQTSDGRINHTTDGTPFLDSLAPEAVARIDAADLKHTLDTMAMIRALCRGDETLCAIAHTYHDVNRALMLLRPFAVLGSEPTIRMKITIDPHELRRYRDARSALGRADGGIPAEADSTAANA